MLAPKPAELHPSELTTAGGTIDFKNLYALDFLCVRSNTPILFSKNNSNNNSDNEHPPLMEMTATNHIPSSSSSGPRHFHERSAPIEYTLEETKSAGSIGSVQSDDFPRYTPMFMDKIDNMFLKKTKYKKLSYADAVKSLEHYYDDYNKYSDEMDILITYIRGQKNLYSQSSVITYMKLYSMLALALCITAFVTVITPFIENQKWNTVLITACNAVATLIISLTRYLQLEFTGNAYSFLANSYERFENSLELANNKLVFMQHNESEQNQIVLEKIKELEFKIGEMKEIFQVLIPNEIKSLFPVISHINIFSLIKKMETHKTHLIVKYKDIKNEINYNVYKINARYKMDLRSDDEVEKLLNNERDRVLFLNDLKERIKNEIINYKDAYNQLDYLFTKEIQFAERHVSLVYVLNWYFACCGKPKYLDIKRYTNPVIQDYLNVILYDD